VTLTVIIGLIIGLVILCLTTWGLNQNFKKWTEYFFSLKTL
jgi:uncharacterized membrane-anchored protein YhcB (DUF1043 family)